MTQLSITFNTRGRNEATALLLYIQETVCGDLTIRRNGTFEITEPEDGSRLAAGMIETIKGTYAVADDKPTTTND